MILRKLLEGIPYVKIEGPVDINIEMLYYDSRKVTPCSLFFCIEGFKFDGHDFAHEAVKKGAHAVVLKKDISLPEGVAKVFVEDTRRAMALISRNFYGPLSRDVTLIGVTGTNGKTTVTYLIKSILEQSGKKVGLIGTIANMIGDKKLPAERTTPESLDLHRLFRQMVNEGVSSIVMEVSSHSLSLNRVAGCEFDVGIFTNLTQDHLDFHGTLDSYRESKAKLFDQSRFSVINVDDESGRIILKRIGKNVITYGIEKSAQVSAKDVDISIKGTSFRLILPTGSCTVNMRIPGTFSVYNALAAAAAAYCLGLNMDQIKTGLEKVKGVPGRFELLETGTDYSVILDYAHTPDGLENILKTARKLTEGRLITLFGCGGDRDPKKRPIMGEVAGRYSDFCIITSDNPRSEEPMAIIEDILPGIKKTTCPYIVIENRREAIEYALKHAKKADVIILAGKGHETYQILKDRTIHFDEKEIVAEILGKEKV